MPGLALQDRLAHPELVDAVAQGLEGLAHRPVLNGGHFVGVEPVNLLQIRTRRARPFRLKNTEGVEHEGFNLTPRLFVVDHHDKLVQVAPFDPLVDDILVPQLGFDAIEQRVDATLHRLVDLDTQHQVHPALQIETEMNGIERLLPELRQRRPQEGRRQGHDRKDDTEQDDQAPHLDVRAHETMFSLLPAAWRAIRLPASYQPPRRG